MDTARTLTNSTYGVLTTLDKSERPHDFVTSGMSAEHHRTLENYTPEGMLMYNYLSGLREPLRVSNYSDYASSIGISYILPLSISSSLTVPIRHAGEAAGNIYLAKQEQGKDYTQEDEETLVLFASQAALVISNARTHREERLARTNMETLIDTCPVGVVILDARTGKPVSFNREARRMVSGLLEQNQPAEELLPLMSIKRPDGRELSLQELTLAQALSAAETVRAEEVVLKLPDDRSVTTLMNATPILSTQGQVESFVITMQDMTPLEELNRQHAEFLGVVSHELRAPLSSIKGSTTTLKRIPCQHAGPGQDGTVSSESSNSSPTT